MRTADAGRRVGAPRTLPGPPHAGRNPPGVRPRARGRRRGASPPRPPRLPRCWRPAAPSSSKTGRRGGPWTGKTPRRARCTPAGVSSRPVARAAVAPTPTDRPRFPTSSHASGRWSRIASSTPCCSATTGACPPAGSGDAAREALVERIVERQACALTMPICTPTSPRGPRACRGRGGQRGERHGARGAVPPVSKPGMRRLCGRTRTLGSA